MRTLLSNKKTGQAMIQPEPTRRHLLAGSVALFMLPTMARAQHHAASHGGKHDDVAIPQGSPADTPVGPFNTVARWAIVVDFNTGATLLSKEANVRMPPSSMTKLMTAYIVYGMLKAGRLTLDQTLPVSERAWRMQGSKMFVPLGGQVRVEELIRGMIIQSGNDACIVLAEGISGSEEQFVELMNAKAKELGLINSNFRNCTGWPDADHYMSCRDIAILAANIIRDFPDQYKYDSEKTFKYNNIDQGNRNTLVQKGLADGLKTGHTEAGGFGIVASAQRNERRVILVLNGMGTMHERAEEGERVLEWAFRDWENVRLVAAGVSIDAAPVYLGTQKTMPLVSDADILVTVPHGWRNTAQVSVQFDAPLVAPITKGKPVGTLTLSGKGVPQTERKLLAGADVPRLGLTGRAVAVVQHLVTGS